MPNREQIEILRAKLTSHLERAHEGVLRDILETLTTLLPEPEHYEVDPKERENG